MSSIDQPQAQVAPDKFSTRIVAALTGHERSLFLDAALATSGLASQITFADEAQLTPEHWARQVEAWSPDILITGWSTPALPEAWLTRADCPLRYVCHVVGSVRHLVPRIFLERGGLVTNWGWRINGQVAEHGLLLALQALRNQPAWAPYIARPVAGRRITDLRTRTLFGLRVGLHGFGGVARALLPLLRPFDVSLTAHSAGVPEAVFAAHGVRCAHSLESLFAGSDLLFECESLTPRTRGTVTAAVLAALPDGALFVNIGRGAVVDDDALVREGRSGRIRLALDVVTDEPLTPASPFLSVPDIVLSPHIGGPTCDRYADCGGHALANVARVLAGGAPLGLIDLASYDRAT